MELIKEYLKQATEAYKLVAPEYKVVAPNKSNEHLTLQIEEGLNPYEYTQVMDTLDDWIAYYHQKIHYWKFIKNTLDTLYKTEYNNLLRENYSGKKCDRELEIKHELENLEWAKLTADTQLDAYNRYLETVNQRKYSVSRKISALKG